MRPLFFIACAFLVAPFVALSASALSSPDLQAWSLHAVELMAVARSVAVGAAAALATTVIGMGLAFQVSFCEFPGRRWIERLSVLPMLMPLFVLAAIYERLLGGLAGSSVGLIFVLTVGLFPYVYLLARLAFHSHGRAFVELGASLRLSFSTTFARVLLPLALPSVLLAVTLVFVESAGEWAAASYLSVPMSAPAIHALWFERSAPELATQLALLFVVVAALVLAPLARAAAAIGSRHLATVSGEPLSPMPASHPWLRLALTALPMLLGFGVPAGAALVFLVQTVGVIDLSQLFWSTVASVALVLVVVTLCVGLALIVGVMHRSKLAGLLVRWSAVSYVVPATVVAVGVLVAAEAVPYFERYGDLTAYAILAAALVVRFAPFVLVPVFVGLSLAGDTVRDAGAAVGLDAAGRLRRLHLPFARGFVLLGALLVVVHTLKETAISVILHPFAVQPLALKAYAYIGIDLLPESSAWIVAGILLGAYPLLTLESMLSTRARS